MSENSNIEWTDHTWSPWEGCTKVSPGCQHCYAEAMNARFRKGANWGKGAPRRLTVDWSKPKRWNKQACKLHRILECEECPRARVFPSIMDWLDDEVPIEWLADLLRLIHETPNLDWLLLTKRPENFRERLTAALRFAANSKDGDRFPLEFIYWFQSWLGCTRTGLPEVPHNVWIGTTVENQEYAEKRIPELLKIPARVRFLSCEPLLGPLEFSDVTKRSDAVLQIGKKALDGIHWVICGGESGLNARLMELEWALSLREQCQAAGVAFFMKQLGGVRKKRGELSDFPDALRVREFPNVQAEASL